MNQGLPLRCLLAIALPVFLISGGCGFENLLPKNVVKKGTKPPAAEEPSGPGLVAIRPGPAAAVPQSTSASATPTTSPAVPAAPAKSEAEKFKEAADALQAQLAEERAALDHDPTPEEMEEDRRLHPPSQIWATISNMKVTPSPLGFAAVSVDYKLICGAPLKHGFYDMRVYMVAPNEKEIGEDTKVHHQFIHIADKKEGVLTARVLEGSMPDFKQYRLAVVLVQGVMPKHYELKNYVISGYLTPEMQSTPAEPPPLPAAEVGAEANGKQVVLAPPPAWVNIPAVVHLKATYEFQVFERLSPVNRYRMVIIPANGNGLIVDVSRDISFAEPYMRIPIHLEAGPFLCPIQRPIRIHIERQDQGTDEWVPVSNYIQQQ